MFVLTVHENCLAEPNKTKDVHFPDEVKCRAPDWDIKKDSGCRWEEEKGSSADSENIPPLTSAPRDSTQRTSASVRRALFARRRFQPTACTPPGGSPQPPQKEPSPPRHHQSPNPPQSPVPPSTCSSPSCYVSSSIEGSCFSVRCFPPRNVHSPNTRLSGSPGSQTHISAPDCPQPKVTMVSSRSQMLTNNTSSYLVLVIFPKYCYCFYTSFSTQVYPKQVNY